MEFDATGFDEEKVGLFCAFVEEGGICGDVQGEGVLREGFKFGWAQEVGAEGR